MLSHIRMWNRDKWTPEEYAVRREAAECMFDYALDLAADMELVGRGFVLEHPAPASSWERPKAQALLATPNIRATNFDQCATGLLSPSGAPMKKRTKLLSNVGPIHTLFAQRQCSCVTQHRTIQGSEWGVQLSTWAQRYPDPMCNLIVQAAAQWAD